LNAESHILVTELALCHVRSTSLLVFAGKQLVYNSRPRQEKQALFHRMQKKICLPKTLRKTIIEKKRKYERGGFACEASTVFP
ncbi:MAG: hypothetical protein K6C08_10680, partial [Oscillospiraceae bacterium]|nr:hypothetical protein [Oscillospiraceae bacterium]